MKKILTALPLFFFIVFTSAQKQADYYLFKWNQEPKQKSFKIMLPQYWISESGIFSIDPNSRGGAANALEAKFDFMIKQHT